LDIICKHGGLNILIANRKILTNSQLFNGRIRKCRKDSLSEITTDALDASYVCSHVQGDMALVGY